ncbi:MmyB family transcriptional regulator [Streptomyces sp. GS7]|uniref:MmyB family transcriptional regulator n=1 Tax=Streptomyces sp. GS7 TaxID=2692234 RepID=UPI001316CAD2|nr:helix-turn-helix domain-containing protein [Streptomyces sp. GS7]QHC26349.1 helix-turn-helix domain-containing protein [Streptomyces sp. GS7]
MTEILRNAVQECEQRPNVVDGGPDELGKLLVFWRERLDPRRIAGVDTQRRRLKPGLTQAEVAHLTGVGLTWYRALEKGTRHDFSDRFLLRLAMTLRLSETEQAVLFQLAKGQAPPQRPQLSEADKVEPDMQLMLDQMAPYPAYLSNLCWDIVANNPALDDWFPWLPYERNMMRLAFLYPEAQQQLVPWKEGWARPFLAQVRVALAMYPDHEGLHVLKDDLLSGNPVARELWAENEAIHHPDGHVRGIRLPNSNRVMPVKIMALAPMGNMTMRFITLLPQETGQE